MRNKEYKITPEQRRLLKKIRRKYKLFRRLYFKPNMFNVGMKMPKAQKIRFEFDSRLKRCWGMCSKFRSCIGFNWKEVSQCTEAQLDGLIIHEMLHFIAKDRHGKHFRYLLDYVNRTAGKKIVFRYLQDDIQPVLGERKEEK